MRAFVFLVILSVAAMPAFADTASSARAHSEAFARAMNAKDVDAVLALYAEDARVVWPGLAMKRTGRSQFAP